jgi:hypothetical protein
MSTREKLAQAILDAVKAQEEESWGLYVGSADGLADTVVDGRVDFLKVADALVLAGVIAQTRYCMHCRSREPEPGWTHDEHGSCRPESHASSEGSGT